jgi:hypothetical protein
LMSSRSIVVSSLVTVAFSGEVGSREENASNKKPALI